MFVFKEKKLSPGEVSWHLGLCAGSGDGPDSLPSRLPTPINIVTSLHEILPTKSSTLYYYLDAIIVPLGCEGAIAKFLPNHSSGRVAFDFLRS